MDIGTHNWHVLTKLSYAAAAHSVLWPVVTSSSFFQIIRSKSIQKCLMNPKIWTRVIIYPVVTWKSTHWISVQYIRDGQVIYKFNSEKTAISKCLSLKIQNVYMTWEQSCTSWRQQQKSHWLQMRTGYDLNSVKRKLFQQHFSYIFQQQHPHFQFQI